MGPREGRIRACQGCQEQKVRCDVQKNPGGECSRCSRMGLECVRTAPSRRNRQTKATLQRELDHLKQKLQGATEFVPAETPVSEGWPQREENMPPFPLPTPSRGTYSAISGSGSLEQNSLDSPAGIKPSATVPRVLDGREYNAQRIDGCFVLFFRDYHPTLPVLDPDLLPNTCYDQSPFLFWTILVTGCRRYAQDPTMLEFLGPRINRLAFSSLSSRNSSIHTIQGLLILCAWPAPVKSMTKDMTYVASGTAIHLAMQLGLHVPGVGQDFSPDKLCSLPLEGMLRHRLWLLACIVCQVTGYSQGLPPTVPNGFLHLGSIDQMMVSDEVRFHWELNRVLGTAMGCLMQQVFTMDSTPLTGDSSAQSDTLNALVKSCDDDLYRLAPQVVGDMRTVLFNCSRLHIGSFYFFSITQIDTQGLEHDGRIELFSIACKVINDIKMVFHHKDAGASCPAYVHRTLILAAFIVLKISRSRLAGKVDLSEGEKAYFTAIVALREASLENDDLYARGAMILAQLWTSTRVFCRSDGVIDGLTLRIRTRLSMGIVFDCFWWWREEFQGKPSPYNPSETHKDRADVSMPQLLPDVLPSDIPCPDPRDELFGTLVEPFPDYDWARSFGFSAPVGLEF